LGFDQGLFCSELVENSINKYTQFWGNQNFETGDLFYAQEMLSVIQRAAFKAQNFRSCVSGFFWFAGTLLSSPKSHFACSRYWNIVEKFYDC
jgi:hypothetical protein